MQTYSFEFRVDDPIDDATTEKLYGRCDDAMTGCENGQWYVAFDRDADSLDHATKTALDDVIASGIMPGSMVIDSEGLACLNQ